MASYLVGVDIGGTFTDCVVIDEAGTVVTAKSPSTPDDFARGMLDAMTEAAAALGTDLDGLCRRTVLLSHGTTIGTNAIVQQRGAPVGLITTKGHNDVIHIMRGSRGITGRDIRQVVHFPESAKPDPIVPKRLIEGVSERVDCFGEVVVPLNEDEAVAAIHRLVAKGVKAIAICFLWSFRYPAHERRVKALVQEIAPDLFVSCSADLVPKWGEYERVTAVALNGYIGPLTSGYLRNLDGRLKARGYAHPLQITQCGGGTISVETAIGAPLLTLDSGPVAGVTGSQYLGDLMGCQHIITTDMGGTSFDVGIIFDGKPAYSFVSNTHQYEYFLPKVDIQAIGSGGGSLVRVDPATRTMRVGPASAGAVPGPACYGRGGTVATVTDADVVLGYLDPDNFAGGKIKLDKAAAERAVQDVADQLGLSLVEAASGIAKIAEFQMADIIRKMTIQKGFDPRDFVLFAFGGAGPAHACVFAGELGVAKVVVPQKKTASTWCAFGAASAHILHIHEQVDIQASPFARSRVDTNLEALERLARERMAADGVAPERLKLQFSIDMRHKGQINEVEVVLPASRLATGFESDLAERFYARYEQLYGKSSSFRGARLEMVTFRVRASAATPQPKLVPTTNLTDRIPDDARRASRAIWWDSLKRAADTPVFDGARLRPGNAIAGPTVVETTDTTVVVHPGKTLRVDAFGNFEIDLTG
ncbi:MAG TPA: hydantoinase/oxoprolinase family protein [Candidatus Sulfotelmatobacter sp.]|nr:hydantoinase/oxoprolinase family protein [Candidatus Sulfotelmatobacter sp.]